MDTKRYIPINEFCSYYSIDYSFIDSLEEIGLVEIIRVEEIPVIRQEKLPDLEKLIRLHRELHINPEGLDAISNLLHRVRALQEEVIRLQNKLHRYED